MKTCKLTLLLCLVLSCLSPSSIFAQLSGDYTIGGTAGDYPDMESAVDDLNQFGISGPTTFTFYSGGFFEQITFGQIAGTENYPIHFTSLTGNPEDVTIQTPFDWLLRFYSTDNIHFSNLTLLAGNSVSTALLFKQDPGSAPNSVDNISLDNVIVKFMRFGISNCTGTLNCLNSDDVTVNNLQVRNCLFLRTDEVPNNNTDLAIHLPLKTTTGSVNTLDFTIENNEFSNSGVRILDGKNVRITKNIFNNPLGGSGIELRNIDQIDVNTNFIYKNTGGLGMDIWNGVACDLDHIVAYNSIVTNASIPSVRFVVSTCSDFYNNTVSNRSTGAALNIAGTYDNADFDYNNYETAGSNLIIIGDDGTGVIPYPDIDSYNAATGFGEHSINVDPLFVDEAAGDLHVQDASLLIGAGTLYGSISEDIDGDDILDPVTIGADQNIPLCAYLQTATFTGETEVCVGATETYTVNMPDCPSCIYSWVVEHGLPVGGGGQSDPSINVHWWTGLDPVWGFVKVWITDPTTGCSAYFALYITSVDCFSCEPPDEVYLSADSDASATTISWAPVRNAISYELKYREIGTREEVSIAVRGTEVNLSNLNLDGEYEYQVRAHCREGYSEWVVVQDATGDNVVARNEDELQEFKSTMFPNPASDEVSLQYVLEESGQVEIKLHNIHGQLIYQNTSMKTEGIQEEIIDLSRVANGTYFINILYGKKNITKKLLVIH